MVMLKKPSSQAVLFNLCGLVLLRKHLNKLCLQHFESVLQMHVRWMKKWNLHRVIKRIHFSLLLELVPLHIRLLTNTGKACTCQTKRRKTKRERGKEELFCLS
jgi:hypothetical protein